MEVIVVRTILNMTSTMNNGLLFILKMIRFLMNHYRFLMKFFRENAEVFEAELQEVGL